VTQDVVFPTEMNRSSPSCWRIAASASPPKTAPPFSGVRRPWASEPCGTPGLRSTWRSSAGA